VVFCYTLNERTARAQTLNDIRRGEPAFKWDPSCNARRGNA